MKNKQVKSFNDLKFTQHPYGEGVMAQHEFPNGNTISVVGGDKFYGDGEATFEVLTNLESLNGENGVLGWQSTNDINNLIDSLQYKGGITPRAAKDLLENVIENLEKLNELGESYAHFQSAKYMNQKIKTSLRILTK